MLSGMTVGNGIAGVVALAILAGLVSLAATGLALIVARRRDYLAEVDHRSSHRRPTPYGGGWGVMASLLPGWAIIGLALDRLDLAGLVALALGLMLVSWIDDRRPLSPAVRLPVQFFAVGGALFLMGGDGLVFQGAVPLWADRLLAAIAWVWFVNLFNFMDGIDGIAGVETIALGLGVALVAVLASGGAGFPMPPATLGLVLAASAAGFLAWNWHPAKIFLGDVGSVPLGFLGGGLLVHLAAAGQLAPALILPAYFVADATVTLARRALRREKLWRPHREHFYQRASRAIGRHDPVTIRVAALNMVLIALAGLAAASAPAVAAAALAAAAGVVAAFLKHLESLAWRPTAADRTESPAP